MIADHFTLSSWYSQGCEERSKIRSEVSTDAQKPGCTGDKMTGNQKHEVGIFSRDGEANYKWLQNLLRGWMIYNVVANVHSIYISNSGRDFITGLSHSSFAIVYHTKRRGRLNIANVTDSLYDNELKDLSDHLGRSNVVVLVDDVEDSGDSNKRRILEEQRLDAYATELILISEREKESANLTGPDPSFSESPISAQMHDAHNSLKNKLDKLKDIINNAPHSNTGRRDSTSSESSSGGRRTDDSSVRSSQRPGSDTRSDEESKLIGDDNQRNPPIIVPIPPINDNEKGQKNWRKDKVLWIIGGGILVLFVVLIIVLCVTL
ncbi:uncharacterized protein [Phyllobates terribilis]|uniref:uncharacterized protein n=1 Tax=Phyllobates terribilis TaxID=111132 RepID=UPI003CCA7FED